MAHFQLTLSLFPRFVLSAFGSFILHSTQSLSHSRNQTRGQWDAQCWAYMNRTVNIFIFLLLLLVVIIIRHEPEMRVKSKTTSSKKKEPLDMDQNWSAIIYLRRSRPIFLNRPFHLICTWRCRLNLKLGMAKKPIKSRRSCLSLERKNSSKSIHTNHLESKKWTNYTQPLWLKYEWSLKHLLFSPQWEGSCNYISFSQLVLENWTLYVLSLISKAEFDMMTYVLYICGCHISLFVLPVQ